MQFIRKYVFEEVYRYIFLLQYINIFLSFFAGEYQIFTMKTLQFSTLHSPFELKVKEKVVYYYENVDCTMYVHILHTISCILL